MDIERKENNFEDSRGIIRDILIGEDVDAITIITCKIGSVRGNHYHKKSKQWSYIVSGRFLAAVQDDNKPIEKKEVVGGDLIIHPPGQKHAFKALEDSVFLSLTKGPRRGKNYEEDTFRLEKPILE